MPIMTGGLDYRTYRTNHPGDAVMQLGPSVVNCQCTGILLRCIHASYPAHVNTCVYIPFIYNSLSLEELKDEPKKEIKSA